MRYLNYYGYLGQNKYKKLTTSHTCQLKNASHDNIIKAINKNIDHLKRILIFNYNNGIMCFRIGSKFIPLATHEIMLKLNINWKKIYKKELREIGNIIKKYKMRITMHPDHFVVINSIKQDVIDKSILELQYHADLLDLMELDKTHKIQIHTGGVFGDKKKSILKWIHIYNNNLSDSIKNRLVLENDDFRYTVEDVYYIYKNTGVPILFDTYHHELNYSDNINTIEKAFKLVINTWKYNDGIPILDYSSKNLQKNAKKGKHCDEIDLYHFYKITQQLDKLNIPYDIILEIKNKDISVYNLSNYILRQSNLLFNLNINNIKYIYKYLSSKYNDVIYNYKTDSIYDPILPDIYDLKYLYDDHFYIKFHFYLSKLKILICFDNPIIFFNNFYKKYIISQNNYCYNNNFHLIRILIGYNPIDTIIYHINNIIKSINSNYLKSINSNIIIYYPNNIYSNYIS
jgi:UV DNA damage endonuclease